MFKVANYLIALITHALYKLKAGILQCYPTGCKTFYNYDYYIRKPLTLVDNCGTIWVLRTVCASTILLNLTIILWHTHADSEHSG